MVVAVWVVGWAAWVECTRHCLVFCYPHQNLTKGCGGGYDRLVIYVINNHIREGESRPDVTSESFNATVKFYVDKAKSLVGVSVPGFEETGKEKIYLRMACNDLKASVDNPDPKTNSDFVKIEGVDIGDYLKLVDAIQEAARKEGLI